MEFFYRFLGQGNQRNDFYQNVNQRNDFYQNVNQRNDFYQNVNQRNNQQQNRNTIQVRVFDLIYNIARHNDDLLENVDVNEYCMFVFFQKTANDLYICSEAKTFEFNLEEKNTIEIELGNGQINGLKLCIKQKGSENGYINDLFGDKYHVNIPILKNFKFVCLDGKFVNGKLDRIEYTKHTKSTKSTKSQDETFCIVSMNQNFYIDPQKYDGSWQKLISERRRSIENKELNSKVENKFITIDNTKYWFTIDNSNLLNKKDTLYLNLGHVLLSLQESGRSVIRNFEENSITVVCFVRSTSFKNYDWQCDFKKVKKMFGDDNSFYASVYAQKNNETPIVTNRLKIFILSGDFSDEFERSNFDSLCNEKKMKFLRDNGFSELELHELKLHELGSRDNSESKEIKKILLLTADFSEKNEIKDISKSLICQFKKLGSDILPSEYWPDERKEEKLAELASKAVIVPSTPKIVNMAEISIYKNSLFGFLKENLNCGFQSEKLPNFSIEIEINGKENKSQGIDFTKECSNQELTKATIKSYESVHSLCLKIHTQNNGLSDFNTSCINNNFNGDDYNADDYNADDYNADDYNADDYNADDFTPEKYASENIKKSNSLELVLVKCGDQGVAFFCKNKKTDIKIKINEFNRDTQLVVKENLGAFIRRRNQWTSDELLTENVIIENNKKLMVKKGQLSEKGKEEFGFRSITDKMKKAKQKSKEEYSQLNSELKDYINEEDEKEEK